MARPEDKRYDLVSQFLGYINKQDPTNTDRRYMTIGSQNVIINDAEKIAIRGGYTLDGGANTALTPIVSSYDWITSTNSERNLRSYNDVLEYRYVDSSGTVTWRTLASGYSTNVSFNFTEWYDATTEKEDFLLFINGTADCFMWSGAITTIASVGTNTLTKQTTDAATWAASRFLTAGTRQVVIAGVTYTYTGGESTDTLTGVTPDPALASPAIAVGAICHQAIRTTSNIIASTFYPGIIRTIDNYVFFADLNKRDIYVSKNTDYTNFTFTSPTRLPGEGARLTLDSNPVGFEVQEEKMYVWGSVNDIYQVTFTPSADLTKETLTIFPLNRNTGQGALSQGAIGKVKNAVFFVTNELSVDTLSRVMDQSIQTTGQGANVQLNVSNIPKLFPISDPVELEFRGYDYTVSPHIKYWQYKTYIAIPSESKVMIYDHMRSYWYPPQILPCRRLAVIDGELYIHSNAVPETYKMFDGTNDNSNPIDARVFMAYNNYGRRDWKKVFLNWFTEGYISSNTSLTLGLNYDFGGSRGNNEYTITGTNNAQLFSVVADGSLGKSAFGSMPLGSINDEPAVLSKFRHIKQVQKTSLAFYEIQVYYASNQVDAQWELLAFGGDIDLSPMEDNAIKV